MTEPEAGTCATWFSPSCVQLAQTNAIKRIQGTLGWKCIGPSTGSGERIVEHRSGRGKAHANPSCLRSDQETPIVPAMRFASLESVRQGAAAALRRFPFPLACAWAACVFFDIAIFTNGTRVVSAGLLLTLGIPLTFALTLLAERSPGGSPIARWLPQ